MQRLRPLWRTLLVLVEVLHPASIVLDEQLLALVAHVEADFATVRAQGADRGSGERGVSKVEGVGGQASF